MKKPNTNEIVLDILAFSTLLVKLGFEDILSNFHVFTEVVNESGFRTERGNEFTYMGLRQTLRRLDKSVMEKFLDEQSAYESDDVYLDYPEMDLYADC